MLKDKLNEALKICAENNAEKIMEEIAGWILNTMDTVDLANLIASDRWVDDSVTATVVSAEKLHQLKSLYGNCDNEFGPIPVSVDFDLNIEDLVEFDVTSICIKDGMIYLSYKVRPLTDIARRRIERRCNKFAAELNRFLFCTLGTF